MSSPRIAPAVTPAVTTSTPVTTPGGTAGLMPVFTGTSTIGNSIVYQTANGIGIGRFPNATLDIGGTSTFRGSMGVSRAGDATTSAGANSFPILMQSSVYNTSQGKNVLPYFQLMTEPVGNNTASAGATLNFMYYSGVGAAPAESGLYFNGNGVIHFSPSQTFPITQGPAGPAGPVGPAGPKGATGATGPQGPSGTLALPYAGSGVGTAKPAFQVTNSGVYSNTAPYLPNGIAGYGGSSGTVNYSSGGSGVLGYGGAATSSSTLSTYGGVGVVGVGGVGNPLGTSSSGGFGGEFTGGDGGGGTSPFGGDGVVAFGGSPNGVGLYVYSAGESTQNTAAVFIGAVDVYGNLYKSSGAFKIDDPIDPANKYLVHSFVESPDMMNIYNGNVVTNGSGEAVVIMPDYFEALNRDFRYQLTTIGSFSKAMVASEISNGKFVIRTEQGNVKVSWQVTGVRQDAWANAHRLPNEVEKTEKERGHFIHPELFGHKGEPSINEVLHPAGRTSPLNAQQ